jgi:hypothetical protein
MARKSTPNEPILVTTTKPNLNGPDFSGLRCERPMPDTARVLQRIKEEADAERIYDGMCARTMGPI